MVCIMYSYDIFILKLRLQQFLLKTRTNVYTLPEMLTVQEKWTIPRRR